MVAIILLNQVYYRFAQLLFALVPQQSLHIENLKASLSAVRGVISLKNVYRVVRHYLAWNHHQCWSRSPSLWQVLCLMHIFENQLLYWLL